MLRKISSIDFKSSNTTSGKTVLIRVDYNVPVENELVTDDYRILKSIPTIKYCLEKGAKVVLMSHMGRPKGKADSKLSLIPAGEKLAELLEMPIKFSDDCISEDAIDVSKNLKDGEIHLLENLRFYNEETENNSEFASKLAKHGSIYINDAFGTAHREHASNAGIAKHFATKGMGFLMEQEVKFLSDKLTNPPKPLSLISNPITVPPDPIRASTLNPLPDPPVTDRFVYPVAIPTFIVGGNCALYPVPPLTVVIPVIIPALLPVPTVAVNIAVEPTPNGFCTSMLSDPEKYPEPAPNMFTL